MSWWMPSWWSTASAGNSLAFQSVQWASIHSASVLVGIGGGTLTEHGSLRVAFLLAALFPLLSLAMAASAIPEARVGWPAGQWRARWTAIREALRRDSCG